ncbi:MAG: preprotein translocase subunit SecE [Cellvibrionales bacterium]|nr:preprotein translocase subunit SecE [Cellvibrionales bacterium]
MSESGQETSGALNTVKWVACLAIVAAGIYGNSAFANEYSVFIRAAVLLGLAGIAGFFALTTTQGAGFLTLLKESKTEIRRVIWPTKQETTQTTMIVIVVVLIMSLILWLLDIGLNFLISKLIG